MHADIGWLLAGLVIALAAGLPLAGAPRRAVRLSWVLLALIGAQGIIGYAQYFSGLPAGLVWVHVSDAVLIWITAIRLLFALRDRGSVLMAHALATDTAAGITGAEPVPPAPVPPAPVPPAPVPPAPVPPGEALSPDVPRR
jgi:cytochrome c oxidase assembly protein subunit 15